MTATFNVWSAGSAAGATALTQYMSAATLADHESPGITAPPNCGRICRRPWLSDWGSIKRGL